MSTETEKQPWERLRTLTEASDSHGLQQFIEMLGPSEAMRAMFRLGAEEQERVLTTLAPAEAAALIEDIPDEHAADMIERLDAGDAAAILNEMDSNDQADVLGEMDHDDAEAILAKMEPEEAEDARRLLNYADNVAGGLMITEFLSYSGTTTAEEVIDELRKRAESDDQPHTQSIYVTTSWGSLVGVVALGDLVLTPPSAPISDIMSISVHVSPETGLDELNTIFEQYELTTAPVIDRNVRLLGVIAHDAVIEALAERADEDRRKMQGIIGGDEIRTMPVLKRARQRLSWLSINIGLNIIAASVIAFYEDTLGAVIALAVFLPIVSDMSGCSGNQAVAVSMRELTLGIVKPFEVARVWLQEVTVGLINGLALGTLLGIAAWLWKGNPYLGLVVGGALAANTILAVSIGGTVPLILKRYGIDPAVASGPILTTATDMCGFFLVLSIANAMLPLLVTN